MAGEPIRCFEGNAQPHEAFWKVRDVEEGEEPEIELYGYISEYSWYEDDVTPAMFKQALMDAGKGGPIKLRINSYGGDVVAASVMYSIIKGYPGTVTVVIDGIAASAATVVAVAADKVTIQPTGYFMIHDPSVSFMFASLNIEDLTRLAGSLQNVKEGIINAYEAKTGLGRKQLANLMTEETWMNAYKALELGFVDAVTEGGKKLALPDMPEGVAVTNAVRGYAHVPDAVKMAMEDGENARVRAPEPSPYPRLATQCEEKRTAELEAFRTRVKAILAKEKKHG